MTDGFHSKTIDVIFSDNENVVKLESRAWVIPFT